MILRICEYSLAILFCKFILLKAAKEQQNVASPQNKILKWFWRIFTPLDWMAMGERMHKFFIFGNGFNFFDKQNKQDKFPKCYFLRSRT